MRLEKLKTVKICKNKLQKKKISLECRVAEPRKVS